MEFSERVVYPVMKLSVHPLKQGSLRKEGKEEKMNGKENPKETGKQKTEVAEREVIINQKPGRANPIHPNWDRLMNPIIVKRDMKRTVKNQEIEVVPEVEAIVQKVAAKQKSNKKKYRKI